MIITKTKFINYTRCPRYVSLEELKYGNTITKEILEEIKKEEAKENLESILGSMFSINEDEEIEDLIDVENPQLKVMMKYYKKVEEVATKKIEHLFKGTTISSEDTYSQKSFLYEDNEHKYICYVDIFNENNDEVNIIEVKATTSKKYHDLVGGSKDNKVSIFKEKNGIYYLINEKEDDIESMMPLKTYNNLKNKLLNRYSDEGKYVFDLAVQRYIIEKSGEYQDKKINYYLAVLNDRYVFDGKYEGEEPIYTDDIVTIFNFNDITKEFQEQIKDYDKFLNTYLKELNENPTSLGKWCQNKKTTKCKYFDRICGSKIPKMNSSLNYMNNGFGFKDELGDTHKGLDLINEGYLNMLDIPESWIKNPNHFIQRDCLAFNKEYLDKEKIKKTLSLIKYPIYHLDFETFNCPLPRFRGEKCYSQSVFEFSLHIEREPGVCDNDKDNYIYLAKDHYDDREECVKKLIELIPGDGTLFAQNVSFEKTRIKELSEIFPEYREGLLKIISNYFDLIYILRGSSKILEELGYEKEDSHKVNYYHKNLSGSYSIKKTLPVFSNLSYANLDVHNGTDAIITYGNYPDMTKEEREKAYNDLCVYCKQDTWAMVVILDEIRKRVM